MEQDILQSAWKGLLAETKTQTELQVMMQERTHPVLKGIRRQLIIELIAFAVFLVFYYDLFDGDKKPLWANVLLVAGISFVMVNNVIFYILTKRPFKGESLKQSLKDRIATMKLYVGAFIGLRVLAVVSLLFFFTSVISFTPVKSWLLTGIVATFIIQLGLLVRVWLKRISLLKKITESFS